MENILITGANGEVGHGLIPKLSKLGWGKAIALDQNVLDEALKPFIAEFIQGSILQESHIASVLTKHKVSTIFHLAAILSTGAEKHPQIAQEINAQGTALALEAANAVAQKEKRIIKFIFPSTIAVYGIPDLETKEKVGKIKEELLNNPITMYGINKLYGEMLGKYYSNNYKLLDGKGNSHIDFRCVRFPGIISALTLPTGGTSDYAPEMIHSVAKGQGYESYVRPDTKIPFMVMPDAIAALIQLTEAARDTLTRNVYNVSGFSLTAKEIEELLIKVFTNASVKYVPDPNRQKIVDSWPQDLNDSYARKDWGWKPEFDIERAFSDYLIPEITNLYK